MHIDQIFLKEMKIDLFTYIIGDGNRRDRVEYISI